MAIVTLVGEAQAKVGARFIYLGPLTECRDCRRKSVCFNLDEGAIYEVVSVREKHHECEVHEGGVRVVELKKLPVHTTIDTKLAIEGQTVNLAEKECKHMDCEHYDLCSPLRAKKGGKYRIVEVFGEVNCPEGLKLKEVLLEI